MRLAEPATVNATLRIASVLCGQDSAERVHRALVCERRPPTTDRTTFSGRTPMVAEIDAAARPAFLVDTPNSAVD